MFFSIMVYLRILDIVPVAKARSLCTNAKLKRGDRVRGNRKSSFSCQAKRGTQQASISRTVPPQPGPHGRGSEES